MKDLRREVGKEKGEKKHKQKGTGSEKEKPAKKKRSPAAAEKPPVVWERKAGRAARWLGLFC